MKSPWRFSSKRLDEESDLINFGRRFYNPAAARWISPDPLGFEAGPNLYAYVCNNPISRIDLYGLEAASTSGVPSRFSAFKNSALSTLSSGFNAVRSFGSGLKQAAISSFRINSFGIATNASKVIEDGFSEALEKTILKVAPSTH